MFRLKSFQSQLKKVLLKSTKSFTKDKERLESKLMTRNQSAPIQIVLWDPTLTNTLW